ncbi:hypothetical protein DCAR_0519164 [Daucus carota subsp. sativus]|uniref:Uncharacterized protein n=1 Tax=Daucus carota subsp. sativus TaxID=79200 RepID=A0AAF1AY99_DAUCS|nr:PREDICTED: uncharacterized protein LOC108221257 [Daucus carota subsp. sativus]WOG99808.1 hypothetical protein DCAR_0519164 [Daucus carota subsp. sativus]
MTHSRSISLPSRPHPSAADVEEQLCRLRSSDETSTSTLCNKLSGLKYLYECVDDYLQLPMRHSSDSEEALGASIRLLDLCNLTKEAFSQMRASVQDLESSLRRREADVSSKIGSYLICMKKVNKMVSKCLASFKKSQNKKCHETSATVSLLREVEEVSITMFESLFSSVFPAKETSKQNRWSLVFKSKQSKRVHEVSEGKVEEMQMDIEAIYKQKINMESDFSRIQGAQKCLMALDKNMQQCEEDLECLYRSLIKTRVSILNVLNQ